MDKSQIEKEKTQLISDGLIVSAEDVAASTLINLTEDHQQKYNIDITAANRRMLDVLSGGEAKRIEAIENDVQPSKNLKDGLIQNKSTGIITHRRKKSDYDKIWELFCQQELEEFEKIMGYDKKGIKHIGIKKFIDAMDWKSEADISKYKTDALHVIPCINCGNEFAVFEQQLGLGLKCQKLFNLDIFWAQYRALGTGQDGVTEAARMIQFFIAFKDFRDNYRHGKKKGFVEDDHFKGSEV